MPKLWEKGYTLDPLIEHFTVGKDYLTDMKLIKYDVIASIAHAEMLAKFGYLSNEELEKLKVALEKLSKLIDSNQFSISPDEEDCHTAIENFLVREVGEIGKKIHMARSRNDQVLTALRLLYKDELKRIERTEKATSAVLEEVRSNKVRRFHAHEKGDADELQNLVHGSVRRVG
jgi:argininosuccinate lyase